MDNPLKRSFDLDFKEKEEKKNLQDAREQLSENANRFLSDILEEDDEEQLSDVDVEEGKMSDILGVPEEEDIGEAYDGSPQDAAQEVVDAVGEDEAASMINYAANISGDEFLEDMQDALKNIDEWNTRGAVESVLASLNEDHEDPNESDERGAVEDVLNQLNDDGEYGIHEEDDDDVPEEFKDRQFGDDEEEEEEEEMDEVVQMVLDELNEDEEDPCWEGYTMVGKKTDENGNEVPNCVPEEDAEDYDPNESALREDWKSRIREDEAPCWDGYTMVGKKMKDGEEVPNCVPDDDVEDYEANEEITRDTVLDAVLEDQVEELEQLDRLAEQVLNG